MHFYFAGAETPQHKKLVAQAGGDRFLMSYYALRNSAKDKLDSGKIFLDSGAFTAFTKKETINIDEYIDFLLQHKDKLTLYANLDVIGDPEATLKNQNYMESNGVNPLPTFHYGGDLKYLKMYAKKYDYIALGGLVPYSKEQDKLNNWLNKCFKVLMPFIQEKKLKVHGFGVGSAEILKKYPFYSADSTGYLIGGKFGSVITWDPQTFKMLGGLHYKDRKVFLERGANLNIQNQDNTGYEERIGHNIREYLKMEKDITRLWNDRGITF